MCNYTHVYTERKAAANEHLTLNLAITSSMLVRTLLEMQRPMLLVLS